MIEEFIKREIEYFKPMLKRYAEKLKQATFNYNREEGYSSKGKHSTAQKFYNKSENLFEDVSTSPSVRHL